MSIDPAQRQGSGRGATDDAETASSSSGKGKANEHTQNNVNQFLVKHPNGAEPQICSLLFYLMTVYIRNSPQNCKHATSMSSENLVAISH